MVSKGRETRIKITAAIRESHEDKLEKIRANYVSKSGKAFSFSGALSLILKYGFDSFEKKHGIKIEKLKTNEEIDDEE